MIKVGKSEEDLDVLYRLGLKLLLDCLNSFIFYADLFWEYHIAKEPNFFLI